MEIKMTTMPSTSLTEIKQAVQIINEGQARTKEGRDRLAQYMGQSAEEPLSPTQLSAVMALVEGLLSSQSSPIEDVALGLAPPPPVNVKRISGLRELSLKPGERPSLKQAIIQVMQETGRTMSANEIFSAVEKRNWIPDAAEEPRKYVGHYLSTFHDVFLRDAAAGRGHYYLAPGTTVNPDAPTRKTRGPGLKKATLRTSSVRKPKKKAGVAAKAAVKAVVKKRKITMAPMIDDATERTIDVLSKTTAPITISDITKKGQIPNHRQVHFLLMNLKKAHVVRKLAKKSESNQVLWTVNKVAFDAFVERFNAKKN